MEENIRQFERIILGIDPGTNVMGYGVLGINKKHPTPITLGVLKLNKYDSHYLRLKHIHQRVSSLIDQYLPDEFAIEAPFFGKNVQSMLKLGRAQGVAMSAALLHDIPIAEYAPLKVKQVITGNGAASKEQVAELLRRILRLHKEDLPDFLDATDALAVALCHYYESSRPQLQKGCNSWKEYIAKHPDNVIKNK